jgi:hypothetical protein
MDKPEEDSHLLVVVDDAWIVHAELNITTLKKVFVVDSIAQIPCENSGFCHLLGTVEKDN